MSTQAQVHAAVRRTAGARAQISATSPLAHTLRTNTLRRADNTRRAFSSSSSSTSAAAASFTPSASSPSPSSSASSRVVSFLRLVGRAPGLLWARVPRGWERFFPDGTASGRTRSGPNDGVGSKNGGGSGGAGGGGSEGPKEDGSGGSSRNSGGDRRIPDPDNLPPMGWLIVAGAVAGATYMSASQWASAHELTYQEFKTRFLEQHRVAKLEVDLTSKKVSVFLKHGMPADTPADDAADAAQIATAEELQDGAYHFYIGSVELFERSLQETQSALGVDPHDFVSVRYINSANNINWVNIGMQVAFYAGLFYLGRQMIGGLSAGKGGKNNPFSFGKSTAQVIKPGDSKITFKDVAGLDEAKVEVLEFVKFLKAPERFKRLGAKIPKGALLCGPPGTGKTLLAKAVAGEAGVPFYSISGSDFLEMFVGVGPSRVRDLFAQARSNTPCIIFIDEIDAVGRARSKSGFGGGNDERENTLNQLLVEMDGMGTTEGVVVLAGTNRKDMLDKALLRPGRFDRHISIDKPDIKGRAQIFMVHLAHIKTDPAHTRDDLAQRLAALTPGFAGADIANLVNEAALIAARADKASVELSDFERASDRVIGGLEKKNSTMSLEEKSLVAHHEAGHAVAAWFLEHADPLLKVTIVPRSNGALGFAQYLPKELSLYHQGQLSDMMAMALGGRAAEQIFFGRVSTGASDDLQKVTRIAQAQVTTYGMSARLGNVSYAGGQEENQFVKPFSEATAQAIDEEVRDIIAQTYARVLDLLEKHRAQVKALADKLIETENVNHDVLLALLGPRPFASDAYTTWRKNATEAAEEAEKKKKEKEAADAAAAAAEANSQGPELATA